MQPYFAPYLGYFDLIRRTDEWVVFDSAQFIRRGWVNRNRLLKQGGGWAYITIPVRHAPLETPIGEMLPDEEQPWRERIFAQFDILKARAPYHRMVREMLRSAMAGPGVSLLEVNVALMRAVCDYLQIRFQPRLLSALGVDRAEITAPDEWALASCRLLRATEYLNPPGGVEIYDPVKFATHGVHLQFQEFAPIQYSTGQFAWEPNLSILDVLAWNSPAVVIEHLDRAAKPNP
ncbi:MAG TPA: WbqC family protein [Opitutaceae bacterium]|nr:WbqC family protein [Opitutaceae bacterium]